APQAGRLDVHATLEADQDTLAQNNEARAVVEVQGPPRVLIVEQRPGEAAVIASALSSTGMRLETRPVAELPDQLDVLGSYAAVVLADVSAPSLSDAQQTTLRAYVRDLGRGLLAIGGDTSVGQGEYIGMPPTAIEDRLAPLIADGGTDIFPGLSTAFDAIKLSDARYKHIILMTDGMSCCGGDYAGLEDRMRGANVTLSTIAVGGDADQALLTQLARQGDGRYYFAEHARDIPRLMTRETELATRGPLVEGHVTPRQVRPDPTLS